MEAFHFLRPWWLLGIPLLLILTPWLWRYLQQYSGWHKVLAPHLTASLLGAQQQATGKLPFTLVVCAWLIACVALAGPTWERLPAAMHQNERAAVIIMDMSMNTRASDVTPDRLTRLRFKALDLLESFGATDVGLVAYAGDAYSISPLTRDHTNMRGMIPALSPEIMPVAGNYPLLAFQEAHRMVTDAGYDQAEFYWFSAGMRQDDYQDLRRFLRGKGHRVSTLIAGDDQSTPIRTASGDMLRDNLGRLSMVQLNSSLFQRLSNDYGGRSVSLRADNSDIEYILGQGALHERVEREETMASSDQWLDRGPYLAWLLLPLALFAARKGVLLCMLMLPFAGLLLSPSTVYAGTTQTAPEGQLRPFSNQQQRAQALYQQGAYNEAAELFQDPFMRGNALYRAEQYGAAIDAYEQAEDSAERWFNTGNALAQLGELDAASDAFEQALARRPEWQEAAENKALVDELREQQQEQQEQPEDGEGEGDASTEQDERQQEQQDEQDQEQQTDTGQEQEGETQEQTAEDESTEDQQGQEAEQLEQQQEEPSPAEQEQQIEAALEDDQLSDEERAELEQLLRRVQSDPAILLRNRMRLEAERRQQTQPPGVRRR